MIKYLMLEWDETEMPADNKAALDVVLSLLGEVSENWRTLNLLFAGFPLRFRGRPGDPQIRVEMGFLHCLPKRSGPCPGKGRA